MVWFGVNMDMVFKPAWRLFTGPSPSPNTRTLISCLGLSYSSKRPPQPPRSIACISQWGRKYASSERIILGCSLIEDKSTTPRMVGKEQRNKPQRTQASGQFSWEVKRPERFSEGKPEAFNLLNLCPRARLKAQEIF